MTLVKNLGFSEKEAKEIEKAYHDLYKVSDEWVKAKMDQASKDGYVDVAFGLRVRTPLLAQVIRGHRTTPYQAEAEARTAGNALGQSYGLLNNRAANAFMEKVWASKHRTSILPIAQIHDAIYLLIKDDLEVVEWVNENLIAEMQWQDLPEIQHDTVKLGAELDLLWPSWAHPVTLPNEASAEKILALSREHRQSLEDEFREAA
jgi:DNA polymerase-1